ncbi:ABC transporter permease [Candidatus Methylacidiphilum fumarolicum]|uniref:ABC-type transport system involved in cytochrome c biogenesis, permease component n=2 Tax=Candidatus Methylacidiphilum fumarolicum TaxID=591154 RepID=I0K0U7_METFB|nr:cytochrome c biogenesis protein CcsA [Candidatus Methylacidiphilum fumarolicum]MBW6414009.1 cytochrome c biogenesis protein CcsA [Candidatus Methylacidiphilum fumarolicum]TFE66361.1 ABC transporter permease [Candidatus Methylacidiphilum fumarolicum]TFE75299.1 ABC transporter permease [Candidatus Methylacidiphilum fumarolicum]TFE76089.1 ABC transporter permease [Candidatus Methylacidiphilum fumarolicum]TFE77232.1 ABC transporter permease [Candidatus Methylacidiphilum fumarolicum]
MNISQERIWLILATVLEFCVSLYGFFILGAKKRTGGDKLSFILLFIAFFLETLFLYLRGISINHCPITNFLETLAFLSWALLLIYFIIGSTYRISILGFFTAPTAFLINLIGLSGRPDTPKLMPKLGWMLEVHAAFSILAYAIFGIAALAAVIYLMEDKELKTHKLSSLFFWFPPIGDLFYIQKRILLMGLVLLTAGLIGGILISPKSSWDWVKISWSIGIWLFYLYLVFCSFLFHPGMKRLSILSIGGFLFIFLTFWGINYFSQFHRF